MILQPLHLMPRLLARGREEFRRGRVERAGEHEILPDEQAVCIAKLVEVIRLVESPAPDADHVHVRPHGAAEQLFRHGARLARGQSVGGNPVRALAENGQTIDDDRHRDTVGVALVFQFHRAQAEAFLHEIVGHAHGQIVERLAAAARGPPQLRVGDGDGFVERVHTRLQRDGPGKFLSVEHDFQMRLAAMWRCDLDGDFHVHAPGFVPLFSRDVIDAAERSCAQVDRPVDAGNHQARTPIPARVTLAFADEIAVHGLHGHHVVRDGVREFLAGGEGRVFGGGKLDADFVRASLQKRLYLETPPHELVVRRARLLAVDVHRGQRVEALAVQENRGFVQHFRRDLERPLEGPIVAADPLQGRLVVGVIGVRDFARREQRAVGIAGHGGGHGDTLVFGAQLPLTREFYRFHRGYGSTGVRRGRGQREELVKERGCLGVKRPIRPRGRNFAGVIIVKVRGEIHVVGGVLDEVVHLLDEIRIV